MENLQELKDDLTKSKREIKHVMALTRKYIKLLKRLGIPSNIDEAIEQLEMRLVQIIVLRETIEPIHEQIKDELMFND